MSVHPNKPICDDIMFDAIEYLARSDVTNLIHDGLVFVTEFAHGGKTYGGSVIARDLESAQLVADDRGLGEKVIGRLEMTVDTPNDPT